MSGRQRAVRAVVNHPGRLALVIAANVAVSAVTVGWCEGWQAGDASWWSVVTATTTGYGDLSPKTGVGRLVAAWLMISTQVAGWILAAVLAGRVIANEHLFSHDEQVQVLEDAALARINSSDALDAVLRLEARLDTIATDLTDVSELARSRRLP